MVRIFNDTIPVEEWYPGMYADFFRGGAKTVYRKVVGWYEAGNFYYRYDDQPAAVLEWRDFLPKMSGVKLSKNGKWLHENLKRLERFWKFIQVEDSDESDEADFQNLHAEIMAKLKKLNKEN